MKFNKDGNRQSPHSIKIAKYKIGVWDVQLQMQYCTKAGHDNLNNDKEVKNAIKELGELTDDLFDGLQPADIGNIALMANCTPDLQDRKAFAVFLKKYRTWVMQHEKHIDNPKEQPKP